MICLNNTNTIKAGASVASVVDYSIHGLVSGAFTVLASGQLSDTDPSVLYTAAENISIVSVTFVNTHSAAVDINFYIDALNAGSPRRLIPKNLTLGVGYSLHFDGQRCSILNRAGALLSTLAAEAIDIIIADAGDIITAVNVEDALQENRAAIDLNTAKDTNVPTALSTGTVGASTYGITSDGGADDVVIAAATNAVSGVATASHISAIEANTSANHTQNTDTNLGAIGTKATPIDADKVIQRDSADSDVIKTSSWTQIKSFLKTYFDTLYNNYVHPNHSGDVTSVADGVQTIADGAVTYAKMQNTTQTDVILGRDTAGSGIIEEISPADIRTMINVEDGSTADQTKGDIDGLGLSHDSLVDVSSDDHHAQTHAATHVTGGADIIANVVAAGNSGLMTGSDKTKLNGIEDSADVTDSANVGSAGAIMDSDITPTEGLMRKTAAGTYTAIKTNLNAALAPDHNDDTGDGYSVGSPWFDTTHDKAYVCLDVSSGAAVWKEITYIFGYGHLKGYILGGYTNTAIIQDLIFADETSQTIVATLDNKKGYGAGVNSSVKGYCLGGYPLTNVIEDLIFADETSQIIVATLSGVNHSGTGVSSPIKGYVLGGYNGVNENVIEDLIFADETSQTITATLDTAKRGGAGVNSSAKGFILGGTDLTAVIEDLIFADETSQTITATLDTAKTYSTGVSSSIKGYVLGGSTGTTTAVIEDLIFADETSQTITATLDTAKRGGAGVNSSIKGYVLGGTDSDQVDVIEDLIFADETSQTITATLDTAKAYSTGINS